MKATDKVSSLLIVLLEAAQGGGMKEKRAKAIYEDIISHYGNIRDGFLMALLEEIAKVKALDTSSDAWIIEHADQLKAELLELAKAGAPRPAPGTVLGRALEMFTGNNEGERS